MLKPISQRWTLDTLRIWCPTAEGDQPGGLPDVMETLRIIHSICEKSSRTRQIDALSLFEACVGTAHRSIMLPRPHAHGDRKHEKETWKLRWEVWRQFYIHWVRPSRWWQLNVPSSWATSEDWVLCWHPWRGLGTKKLGIFYINKECQGGLI